MKKIKIITSKEKKKSCRLLALSIITSILFPSYSFAEDAPQQCPAVIKQLDDSEIEIARQAWKYFDNNFQKTTGLVNAVDGYPSTTLWDSGSSMAAFIAAEKMGIITSEQFHKIVKSTLYTLATLDQFNGRAPNKVYNTETAEKVDYANKYSEQGIGISILDLARITSWLNILSCLYPEHKEDAEKVLESWSYCELFDKGEMYGMGIPEEAGESKLLQEGRLGYEQYAAKVFKNLGFKLDHSADYRNKHTDTVKIYDIPISVDKRDSATLGAYNYVVTESYVMDIIENGRDDVLKSLTKNIFKVQEQRWKKTDQVTAVSEDNLDQAPYFVYNTIYTDGENWKALTDTGEDMAPLKTVSTKAAFSMAYVFPEEE